MALINPTPRPSMVDDLRKIYDTINGTNPTGIRSQLARATPYSMAWGLGKRAGAPAYQSINKYTDGAFPGRINRSFQPTEFAVLRPGNNSGNDYNTSFNRYAQQYAVNAYKHNNTSYR